MLQCRANKWYALCLQFYQRFLERPIFDTATQSLPPDEPHFICRLTCPAVVGDGGRSFCEQVSCFTVPVIGPIWFAGSHAREATMPEDACCRPSSRAAAN